MAAMKHVGKIKNTGRRCVVVFREMYDDKGRVIDENNCLVFETESLPDAEHQDLMRIVESENAQTTGDLFNVLARARLGSGDLALGWLSRSNRLRKFPTSNIEMTPDARTKLGLDTLNKIVKMQKSGANQQQIENVLRNDTDMPPRQAEAVRLDLADDVFEPVAQDTANALSGDGVLDDAAIAKSFLEQAEVFEKQVNELRERAYSMDPTLKPATTRRKRPAPVK
jgi:hypothetical protein